MQMYTRAYRSGHDGSILLSPPTTSPVLDHTWDNTDWCDDWIVININEQKIMWVRACKTHAGLVTCVGPQETTEFTLSAPYQWISAWTPIKTYI